MLAPPRATAIKVRTRAVSSVGRAPALHAGCRRFESVTAHRPSRLRRFSRQAILIIARRLPNDIVGQNEHPSAALALAADGIVKGPPAMTGRAVRPLPWVPWPRGRR